MPQRATGGRERSQRLRAFVASDDEQRNGRADDNGCEVLNKMLSVLLLVAVNYRQQSPPSEQSNSAGDSDSSSDSADDSGLLPVCEVQRLLETFTGADSADTSDFEYEEGAVERTCASGDRGASRARRARRRQQQRGGSDDNEDEDEITDEDEHADRQTVQATNTRRRMSRLHIVRGTVTRETASDSA